MSSIVDRLKSARAGSNAQWILDHLDYPHDYCLIWPFALHKTGYAYFGCTPQVGVHRIMCEHKRGPAPSPKHHAGHSCGRGDQGCVNPNHVRWQTNAENQLERYRKNGPGPRQKLTPEQVDEIRALANREHVGVTAKRFGITEVNVRHIQSGKLWKADSKARRRVFTADEVRDIRGRHLTEHSRKVGKEYGVSMGVIQNIQNRRTYRYVTDAPERSA